MDPFLLWTQFKTNGRIHETNPCFYYSETGLLQIAWGHPNVFVITGICYKAVGKYCKTGFGTEKMETNTFVITGSLL